MTKASLITLLTEIKDSLIPHDRLLPASTEPARQMQWSVLKPVCKFINAEFCDCQYVQYFIADMDYGKRIPETEMGAELKDCTSIELFVDFLYNKKQK
jgi:hypothetical protein